MKRAIVVGTGAGGSTVAKELQGRFEVTILEAGGAFRPFTANLNLLGALRRTGLFLDEREIQLMFPAMRIRKARGGVVLVKGAGWGGTTTIATGNGVRMDRDLKALGIDLDAEFEQIFREIPVTTSHQKRWHPATRRLFEISREMGLDPQPTPKMGNYDRCIRCGRCIFGCSQGAKWDARNFLVQALGNGATLLEHCTVQRVVVRDGVASGVEAQVGRRKRFYPGDVIILAAGGLGTPVILEKSGIPCERRLFVDPVLCVAGPSRHAGCQNEISMPFIIQRDRYLVSPYIDYLSFFFNRAWRYNLDDIVSLMVKLADSPGGSVTEKGVTVRLTDADRGRVAEGIELCREILRRFGVREADMFLGTMNAGHPGGMLPLTSKEAETLHNDNLPENLYLADSTVFPNSLGNPPILTIVALAKRVSRLCAGLFDSGALN